jgi:hypothetical protein
MLQMGLKPGLSLCGNNTDKVLGNREISSVSGK